jgi:Xaa-Pro aminopeptidase
LITPDFDYSDRLSRTTTALLSAGVDATLLCPGADMFYLSGFEHGHAGERLLALVLRSDGQASWIAPVMNVPQLRERVLPDQPIRPWGDSEGFLHALREAIAGANTIAFDDEARAGFLLDLIAAAPRATIVKAGGVMRSLRICKDANELAGLRRAAQTVDATIPEAFALCSPGRTEAEIDADLRRLLLARSPDSSVAFTIIGAGPSAALPHHETGQRRVERGQVVLLDFGTRGPDGYHSDITVVCSVGEPADPEVRKVYRVVHEAQQAAIAAIRPGVPCTAIDEAARSVIERAGYGEYFLHRTGHGLGLQVHEPPFLVAGNNEKLAEGMVFSIEPGIYLPNRFGVRLEVIATVTKEGGTLINAPSARELPVI